MFTDGDSLLHFDGQDLLEDCPSDSFSARRGSQRSFVSPVGALSHLLEELRDLHVSDGPGSSSLEALKGYVSSALPFHEERFNEFVLHSTTCSSIKEDRNSRNSVVGSSTLLFEHELDLNIVGDSIDGMLRRRSDNGIVGSVLSVQAHGVNHIELSASGDVERNVSRSPLHGARGDVLKALGANSKLGVVRGGSRCEVDRGLLLTSLASERPVVSIHAVVDHDTSEGVVGRVEHPARLSSLLTGISIVPLVGLVLVLLGGNVSSKREDGSKVFHALYLLYKLKIKYT